VTAAAAIHGSATFMLPHEQVKMLHRSPWQWSRSSCRETEAKTARGVHTTRQVPRMSRSLTRAAVLRCVLYCFVLSCTCVVLLTLCCPVLCRQDAWLQHGRSCRLPCQQQSPQCHSSTACSAAQQQRRSGTGSHRSNGSHPASCSFSCTSCCQATAVPWGLVSNRSCSITGWAATAAAAAAAQQGRTLCRC
jgi:hypothetical protein